MGLELGEIDRHCGGREEVLEEEGEIDGGSVLTSARADANFIRSRDSLGQDTSGWHRKSAAR